LSALKLDSDKKLPPDHVRNNITNSWFPVPRAPEES
jgi:hypothetical protein